MPPEHHGHFNGGKRPRLLSPRPHALNLTRHLNSVATETLLENIGQIGSIDQIRAFLEEAQPEDLVILESVLSAGDMSVSDVVCEYAMREAEASLRSRRSLIADLREESFAVFLPLPPHVVDLVRDRLGEAHCFNTEERVPSHQRFLPQVSLGGSNFAAAFEQLSETTVVALDGQYENEGIFIRSSVAPLIGSMRDRQLKRVYFHRIPHIPPGQEFSNVALDFERVEVRFI